MELRRSIAGSQAGSQFWVKNVHYLHFVFELKIKVDLTEIVVVLMKFFKIFGLKV